MLCWKPCVYSWLITVITAAQRARLGTPSHRQFHQETFYGVGRSIKLLKMCEKSLFSVNWDNYLFPNLHVS